MRKAGPEVQESPEPMGMGCGDEARVTTRMVLRSRMGREKRLTDPGAGQSRALVL